MRWVVTGQAPSTQPHAGINHDDDDLVATSGPVSPLHVIILLRNHHRWVTPRVQSIIIIVLRLAW